ncbi:SGNH/GDSL hydrolase family protein [Piscirickettsia litoralis]|uniref:GDSL family lipase n=1 Tax=Piscirickettsia litoralis TaxID=1891921 RepID=A0ABX3A361_9GAMM|nr:SGNH/GDSL hydrolase family protein [Piscirickettsia litoralis]ODN43316.1 hypothetical protein BGC07_10770 [Piscirickettsia litoralis]
MPIQHKYIVNKYNIIALCLLSSISSGVCASELYSSTIPGTQSLLQAETPEVNIVIKNDSNTSLTFLYNGSSGTVVAGEVRSFKDTQKLYMNSAHLVIQPNGVSADGARHNWTMTGYSGFGGGIHLNSAGLGKATTWPGFTTIGISSNLSEMKAQNAYHEFAENMKVEPYKYRSNKHLLKYLPAGADKKLPESSSIQGSYGHDGSLYRWCSYNSNQKLSRCGKISDARVISALAKLGSPTKQKPTYYIEVKRVPKNITPYSEMYTLGDSLTDTQNVFYLTGGDMPRGVLYNGRWSNGLMWPDYVYEFTGLPVHNYAFGGMEIVHRFDANKKQANGQTALATDTFYMPSKLPITPNFKDQLALVKPELVNSLNHAQSNKKVLLSLFMGGNDIMEDIGGDALDLHKASQVFKDNLISFLNDLKNNDKVDFSKLSILLFTVPDITIAPQLHQFLVTQNDEPGRLQRVKKDTIIFNESIFNMEKELKNNYPDLEVKLFDAYSSVKSIQNDPDFYQFTPGSQPGVSSQLWGQKAASKGSHDSSNFMGYVNMQGVDKTIKDVPPILTVIGSVDIDRLIPYNPAIQSKAVIGGGVHPSTKTHFILASQLIYKNLLSGQSPSEQPTYYLQELAATKGFTNSSEDPVAFSKLLDMANSMWKTPDFADCINQKNMYL